MPRPLVGCRILDLDIPQTGRIRTIPTLLLVRTANTVTTNSLAGAAESGTSWSNISTTNDTATIEALNLVVLKLFHDTLPFVQGTTSYEAVFPIFGRTPY
jgi:hypothetical protein